VTPVTPVTPKKHYIRNRKCWLKTTTDRRERKWSFFCWFAVSFTV